MRASEAYRRHTDETDGLIEVLQQREREFAEKVSAAEPGGAAAVENYPVLVHKNEDIKACY